MKNAVIIHGSTDKGECYDDEYPSLSNSHWIPWLQKQLLIKDIFTQTPEMPEPYSPDYRKWKKEFERFDANEESIFVGFSCGGGFLIRWLSENKVKINKLVLVAPWIDPNRNKKTTFFDFDIDSSLGERIDEIHLLISDKDSDGVNKTVQIIKKEIIKVNVHEFPGYGHFTFGNMKTEKFPELLNIIVK